MPREQFIEWYPYSKNKAILGKAEEIASELHADGYDISLRQLFYALVSRGILPNTFEDYKNLGNMISNARLAGLFDWSYIVDRGRTLRGTNHYDSVGAAVARLASGYRVDKWARQDYRVEVWVEKDALSGVVARPANLFDIDFFACKGNVSQSEMYGASKRFSRYAEVGQQTVILYLGDHDPSGLDMTRDVESRLSLMTALGDPEPIVRRLALNIDQVRELNPPPNPVKLKDSRAKAYIEEFGVESWELDALPPRVLAQLVDEGIREHLDDDLFAGYEAIERIDRDRLEAVSAHWPTIVDLAKLDFELPDPDEIERLTLDLDDARANHKTAVEARDLALTQIALQATSHKEVVAALKAEITEAQGETKHALKARRDLLASMKKAMEETADTTRAGALKKKLETLS